MGGGGRGGGQAGRQHGVDSCLQVCLVGGGKVGEDVHHTQQPGYLGQGHLHFPLLAGCDVVLEPRTTRTLWVTVWGKQDPM